jgi:NAD(P)-dependent dehydrogenase (short-subunit alcohol dehydrogenase family)
MYRICIVTGATSGIGREIALGLARTGAELLLVGRDASRTQAAVAAIAAEARNARVTGLVADLTLQSAVRELAAQIHARCARVDVLVNNAGAIFPARALTAEGFERTWALNHLAYVALTLQLLDLLRRSSQGRVINVASGMHARGQIRFDNLQGEHSFSSWTAYSQSKLANVLFTYALARRLAGTALTANCLRPGTVASGFGSELTGLAKWSWQIVRPLMRTPAQGAEAALYLATAPEVAALSGRYWQRREQRASSPLSMDQALQEELWRVSLAQCGLAEPSLGVA